MVGLALFCRQKMLDLEAYLRELYKSLFMDPQLMNEYMSKNFFKRQYQKLVQWWYVELCICITLCS